MTTRVADQIDDWKSEPFDGGYERLHELAADEFSGVVQSMAAKLCFLNGTAVGILDGSIEDFEDEGRLSYAPSPALPLLALMQERSDEVRAKYYSEDTSISEVDSTLTDGKFSGYIELSENVLSGDYYVVYHAGRSMAVAYVGNSGQLLTDDEAFERADDEIGIYQVRPVEIEPVEIPEPATATGSAADGPAGGGAASSDQPATGGSGGETASAGSAEAGTVETDTEPEAATGEAKTTARTDSSPATDSTASGDQPSDAASRTTERSTAASGTEPTSTDQKSTEARSTERRDTEPTSTEATSGDAASADEGRPEAQRSDRSQTDATRGGEQRATERGPDESRPAEPREDEPREDEPRSGERREEKPQAETPTGDERSAAEPRGDEPRGQEGKGAETSRDQREGRTSDPSGEARPASRRESTAGSAGGESRTAAGSARERTRESGTSSSADRPEGGAGEPDRQSRSTQARPGQGDPARGGRDVSGEREPTQVREAGSGDVGSPAQLEMRSVPSLDPELTTAESAGGAGGSRANGVDLGPNGSERSTAGAGSGRSSGQATPDSDRGRGDTADASTGRTNAAEPAAPDRRETAPSADARGAGSRRAEATADRSEGADDSEQVVELEADLEEAQADLEATEAEVEELEAELEELEADLASVEAEREDLRAERDRLREERSDLQTRVDELEADRDELDEAEADLRAERDELQSEVDRLQSQLEQLEDEYGAATDAERRLSRAEALEGTNLFVRYDSKGEATLASAHDGNASSEKVTDNLDLEFHTQFEAAAVSVGGKDFEEYLTDTIEYRFVSWVVYDLLYEIRDTGKAQALADLYDAIPRIDRAELDGTVTAEYREDGQERRTQESFDVVLRDRMGNALVVANMNDSRQAASESMMNTLVTAASRVGDSNDSLAAGCLVTSSFFEPEALETAADATSGGLLSRDKRESFVKLSRKRGYHLCLAEARDGKFHLAVPEL